MEKRETAILFNRLSGFHIDLHITQLIMYPAALLPCHPSHGPGCIVAELPAAAPSLSHGTQGMGLAQGQHGEGEEVGWKVHIQVSSPDGVNTLPRS